jgi:uncharacterized protein
MNKAQYISGMDILHPSPAHLPIRKLTVDLSQGFERHWIADASGRPDAFRTAYYNALSMSFPAGEQLFIDSVKRVQPRLGDGAEHAAMHETIRDFCAQEATHRHIHAQYNAHLAKQGLINHVESRIWARFKRHEHVHPLHHLGVTVAYEHYTAVLSDALLRHDAATSGMSESMRQVWRWHALEETEHKAVAFDLYQALGGNHTWRVRWFVYVSILFTLDNMRQTLSNLWHDGSLFKPRTWASAAQFFFGSPKRGGGWMWLTAKPLLDFLRKDFHPNQHDNRALASDYAHAHQADWRLIR